MDLLSRPEFWFLLTALPFCLWAAYSDLKYMIIPNWLSILMILAFLVPGLIFLDFTTVLWRLLAAFATLVVGFILNALRMMGGGDAKFATAMAPFIALATLERFMLAMGLFLFAALLTHRFASRVPALRGLAPDWVSWTTGRNFPMGFAMAGALIWYLAGLTFSG